MSRICIGKGTHTISGGYLNDINIKTLTRYITSTSTSTMNINKIYNTCHVTHEGIPDMTGIMTEFLGLFCLKLYRFLFLGLNFYQKM